MTASIAVIQYQKSDDSYKMRIGDELFDLPSSMSDSIGVAIGKVEPFNTVHAMVAREMWSGDFECDPDVIEFGYE